MHWQPDDSPLTEQVTLEERVQKLATRSLKKESKLKALHLALSLIDLTTLEGKDTTDKILHLCEKAKHLGVNSAPLPTVAAVCVYPNHVRTAKSALGGSGLLVASVATAFPSGNLPLKLKLEEVKYALEEGADEIDMVINRGEFLKGNYTFVFDEIARVKQVCKNKTLKVILETGELSTLDNIRKASDLSMAAGADFIKTSTGKIPSAANPIVSLVMLEAIHDFYLKTGKKIGFKPAGGISTSKTALQYLVLVHEVLGEAWLNKSLLRFGASSLVNDILLQLAKEHVGVYYSKDYISID